jgi:hypothetical protein
MSHLAATFVQQVTSCAKRVCKDPHGETKNLEKSMRQIAPPERCAVGLPSKIIELPKLRVETIMDLNRACL